MLPKVPDWARAFNTPNGFHKLEWLQDARDPQGNLVLKHGGEYMLSRAFFQKSTGHGPLRIRRGEQRPRWQHVGYYKTVDEAVAAAYGRVKLSKAEKHVLGVLIAGGTLTPPWSPNIGNWSVNCYLLKSLHAKTYAGAKVRRPTIEKMSERGLLHLVMTGNTQGIRPTYYAEKIHGQAQVRQTGRNQVRQGETEKRRGGVHPHERAQVVLPRQVRRKAKSVQHAPRGTAVRRAVHQGLDTDQANQVVKLDKKETELVNRLNRGGVLRLCCYGRNTGKYYVRTFAANTVFGYRTFNEAYYPPKFVRALIAKGVLQNRAYKKNYSFRPTEAYKKIKL